MDFFEAQEAARRRTTGLVGLFLAAVVAIIVVIYLVVHVAVAPGVVGLDPVLLLQVALGVGLVIALGSGFRIASLRSGGPAVAELLGARRVASDTTDADERKLLNVVEEMSIASGTPMPAVYVMDGEDGINAFAAGYTTHDAAVAVTRGGLRALNRSELQGVIAHEFSHILNGDMRLNIRLIGLLYGILLLAVIGRGIVWAGPRGGRRGGRDGGAGWIILLGLALLLVGYIGVFFGKIIQAAVSRQREYLADSAAVEFTRDPDGLAGALKKIGAASMGSRIGNPHAEEVSHLFFASGVRSALGGALATHPPLDERIRRLDPSWTGDYAEVARSQSSAQSPPRAPAPQHRSAASRHGFEASAAVSGLAGAGAEPGGRGDAADLVASVGAPRPEHLAYASALLGRLPAALTRAVHDPLESRAVIFALIVAGGDGDEEAALEPAARYGGEAFVQRVRDLLPDVRREGRDARLPLLDLSLPSIERLSPEEGSRFRTAVEEAIRADGTVRTFEYALSHTLSRRLDGPSARDRGRDALTSLRPARAEVEALLSAVAWAGARGSDQAAARAVAAGAARLPADTGAVRLRELSSITFPEIDGALSRLEAASPRVKRSILEACAAAAAHDGRLDPAEGELLRAISESLDCPMPPSLLAAPIVPRRDRT
jgi:Zn-dependent protease with chaperone function